MATEEDWLFRPVLDGYLSAEKLIDGSVDLEFIATLNEAADVRIENMRRLQKKT